MFWKQLYKEDLIMPFDSKYEILRDKDWLKQKYIAENLRFVDIARSVNVPKSCVRRAIIAHGIKLKERKFKIVLPPEANDRDWLYKKYWEEGLSLNEISVFLKIPEPIKNSCRIRTALIKAGIKVRSKGEGHLYMRPDEGFVLKKDIIEGCLLGDGFFKVQNRESDDSFPGFMKKNTFKDHVEFVAKLLIPNRWRERIRKIENKETMTIQGRTYPRRHKFMYYFQTLCHTELLPLYRQWYPKSNNYKKVIPESIDITPATLLHWFLDDGSSFHRKYYYDDKGRHKYKTKQVIITFACQSFTEENLWSLCEKIKNKFNLKIRPSFHQRNGFAAGTGMEVVIDPSQCGLFYEIIGPPPIKSLAYKWK